MLPKKILKNRVSLMLFPAFWCGFLCMEQVTNEKKIQRCMYIITISSPTPRGGGKCQGHGEEKTLERRGNEGGRERRGKGKEK